jgi:hypothetical protein
VVYVLGADVPSSAGPHSVQLYGEDSTTGRTVAGLYLWSSERLTEGRGDEDEAPWRIELRDARSFGGTVYCNTGNYDVLQLDGVGGSWDTALQSLWVAGELPGAPALTGTVTFHGTCPVVTFPPMPWKDALARQLALCHHCIVNKEDGTFEVVALGTAWTDSWEDWRVDWSDHAIARVPGIVRVHYGRKQDTIVPVEPEATSDTTSSGKPVFMMFDPGPKLAARTTAHKAAVDLDFATPRFVRRYNRMTDHKPNGQLRKVVAGTITTVIESGPWDDRPMFPQGLRVRHYPAKVTSSSASGDRWEYQVREQIKSGAGYSWTNRSAAVTAYNFTKTSTAVANDAYVHVTEFLTDTGVIENWFTSSSTAAGVVTRKYGGTDYTTTELEFIDGTNTSVTVTQPSGTIARVKLDVPPAGPTYAGGTGLAGGGSWNYTWTMAGVTNSVPWTTDGTYITVTGWPGSGWYLLYVSAVAHNGTAGDYLPKADPDYFTTTLYLSASNTNSGGGATYWRNAVKTGPNAPWTSWVTHGGPNGSVQIATASSGNFYFVQVGGEMRIYAGPKAGTTYVDFTVAWLRLG